MLPSCSGILAEAICMTIRPEFRVPTDLLILFAHHHSTKIYGPLSFNLSFVMTIGPKIRVLTGLFLLFGHDHSIKVIGHSYSLIYSFLNCSNVLFGILKVVLLLYFVRSISGSIVFIFRPLCS